MVVFDIAATPPVDVTAPAQVESALRQVIQEHGRLDILINVAGGSGRQWGDGPADACTIDGWEKTLTLNLNGVFYCCKYALQAMLLQTDGRKIFLLPAWPKDWNVDFRLYAPQQTLVEGVYRDGRMVSLKVTPESRRADVEIVRR